MALKRKSIDKGEFTKGILKIAGGLALQLVIPIGAATSGGILAEAKKDYNDAIDYVKSTTAYQQTYKEEMDQYQENYDNRLISYQNLIDGQKYLESDDFVLHIAKNNYPEYYQELVKDSKKISDAVTSTVVLGAFSVVDVAVTAGAAISEKVLNDDAEGLNLIVASGVRDVKKSINYQPVNGNKKNGKREDDEELEQE